jgi:hypothetical protein
MDNFQPQSGSAHVSAGHEEGDFSVRGIILFVIILVLSAVATFIAASGLMRLFEWAEVKYFDKPQTAVQQQLTEQRGEPATKAGIRPQPDWYTRAVDEEVLRKTFTTPRLQYDDTADMGDFLSKEKKWLESTGKNPDGSAHIPIDRAIDLVSKQGLPLVNGTFTSQPPLGGLEAVSEAAQRRLQEAGAQGAQQVPKPSNRKK